MLVATLHINTRGRWRNTQCNSIKTTLQKTTVLVRCNCRAHWAERTSFRFWCVFTVGACMCVWVCRLQLVEHAFHFVCDVERPGDILLWRAGLGIHLWTLLIRHHFTLFSPAAGHGTLRNTHTHTQRNINTQVAWQSKNLWQSILIV